MGTEARTWVGRTLVGNDGSRLGEIVEVFADDDGDEWLAISPPNDPYNVRLVPTRGTTVRGVKDIITWFDKADLERAASPDGGAEPEPAPATAPPRSAPPRAAAATRPAASAPQAPATAPPRPAVAAGAATAPRPVAARAAAPPRRTPPSAGATPSSRAPRKAPGKRRAGTNLVEIEGLGFEDADTLVAAGVRNIDALLSEGGSAAGRRALAKETGIGAATILEWVNRADLMRIRGVGAEYSDLLESSGVDTVRELSKRNPANLQARMAELNDEQQLVRRAPSLSEVERWVAEAKDLPVAVTY